MSDRTGRASASKRWLPTVAAALIVAALVAWRMSSDKTAAGDEVEDHRASSADKVPDVAADRGAAAPSVKTAHRPVVEVPQADAPPTAPRRVAGEPAGVQGVWIDVAPRSVGEQVSVLALHGRGDTARNFASMFRGFADFLSWRALQAPQPWSGGFRWFDIEQLRRPGAVPSDALQLVRAHVEQMQQPVVLLGFSQGCMTLLHAVAEGIEKVAAGVCIGGWAVGELRFGSGPNVPLLFVSGAQDKIATPEKVREAIQLMENHGFSTEHIEHAAGHVVPMEEANRISAWIKRVALHR